MSNEKHFLFNWSSLTDNKVIENIEYLQKHYKEYDIRKDGKDGVKIISKSSASVVRLSKAKFQNKDVFVVNERICTDGHIYNLLSSLFYDCEEEIEMIEILQKLKKKKIRKRNRKIWWNNNGVSMIVSAALLVGFGCSLFFSVKDAKKQKQINKKVKQYEKTLPNYQEYQQKIANYRDSLAHATR